MSCVGPEIHQSLASGAMGENNPEHFCPYKDYKF